MKRDIIAEIKSKLAKVVFKSALAEEPTPSGDSGEGEPNTPPTPSVNFEDLIAKAREDEKKKQMKTIERLKSQNASLVEQHNNDLLLLADKDKEIQGLNEKLTNVSSGDTEQVKTLKAEIKDKEKTIKSLEKKIEEYGEPINVDELTEQIRSQFQQEFDVKEHRLQVLNDNKDTLLVPELVMGTTVEEIDKSLEVALARSEEIRKSLGGAQVQQPMPKPSNPTTATIQQGSIDYGEYAKLDVSSPQFAEMRKKLGLR